MSDKELRKMAAACRVAHRTLWRNRTAIIQGHSIPAGSLRRDSITDPDVLAWLDEHDRAIWRLRDAIDLAPTTSRARTPARALPGESA
jgi:hypothetical protein